MGKRKMESPNRSPSSAACQEALPLQPLVQETSSSPWHHPLAGGTHWPPWPPALPPPAQELSQAARKALLGLGLPDLEESYSPWGPHYSPLLLPGPLAPPGHIPCSVIRRKVTLGTDLSRPWLLEAVESVTMTRSGYSYTERVENGQMLDLRNSGQHLDGLTSKLSKRGTFTFQHVFFLHVTQLFGPLT